MSEQKVNSVFPKLLELRKKVSYIQKNADGHNYKYVDGSNVLGFVKPIMNKLGLILIPSSSNTRMDYHTYTKPKFMDVWVDNKKEKKLVEEVVREYAVSADITYAWIDTETGDEVKHTFFGTGSDSDPSKAEGKMYTYTERYHLLKTLNIATDDDDPDAYTKKYEEIFAKEELIDEYTEMREKDTFVDENISAMEKRIDKSIDAWTLEKLVGLKGYLEKLRKEKEETDMQDPEPDGHLYQTAAKQD